MFFLLPKQKKKVFVTPVGVPYRAPSLSAGVQERVEARRIRNIVPFSLPLISADTSVWFGRGFFFASSLPSPLNIQEKICCAYLRRFCDAVVIVVTIDLSGLGVR